MSCDLCPTCTTCLRVVRPLRPLSVSHDLFPTSFRVVRPLCSIDLFPIRTTSLRHLSVACTTLCGGRVVFSRPVTTSVRPLSDLCPTLSSECCFLLFLVGVCSFFVRSFSSVTTPSQVTSSYKLACVLLCFCSILCGVRVEGSGESYKFEIERFSKAPIHPPSSRLISVLQLVSEPVENHSTSDENGRKRTEKPPFYFRFYICWWKRDQVRKMRVRKMESGYAGARKRTNTDEN